MCATLHDQCVCVRPPKKLDDNKDKECYYTPSPPPNISQCKKKKARPVVCKQKHDQIIAYTWLTFATAPEKSQSPSKLAIHCQCLCSFKIFKFLKQFQLKTNTQSQSGHVSNNQIYSHRANGSTTCKDCKDLQRSKVSRYQAFNTITNSCSLLSAVVRCDKFDNQVKFTQANSFGIYYWRLRSAKYL